MDERVGSMGVSSGRASEVRLHPPGSWAAPQEHLRQLLNSDWYRHLARIYDECVAGVHAHFRRAGFRSPPLPVTAGCCSSPMGRGSDSLPVQVTLGGQRVYLADSMQFHLELFLRVLDGPVYYVMPSFRGEAQDGRHLNEFHHAEAELQGDLSAAIARAEQLIVELCETMLVAREDSILAMAGTSDHVRQVVDRGTGFERIAHRHAVELLEGVPGALESISSGLRGITPRGERALLDRLGDFVWITHFPDMLVPFYQAVREGTDESETADLLAGAGEILGAGARVVTSEQVQGALQRHEVPLEGYAWYSDMRRMKEVATAGFGLGLERLLMWVTRSDDIRDVCLLHRQHGRVHSP